MKKISRFAKGLKARQEEQIAQGNTSGSLFNPDVKFEKWKPSKGNHFIDIIPYFAGKNDSKTAQEEGTYMFTVWAHYSVGTEGKVFVCPKHTKVGDKRCPICEHMFKMKNEGEEFDVWKDLRPKQREIYNVVCQDSEKEIDKGVQVYEVSYFFMGKVLEPLMFQPVRPGMKESDAYIAFASETSDGKTLGFKVGEKKVGTQTFPEYSGHRFVDRDYDVEEYLDHAHKLDEIINIPTYKDIYEAYWDEPEGSDKEDDTPEERPASRPASRSNAKKKEKKESEIEKTKSLEGKNTSENLDSMTRSQLQDIIKEKNISLDPDIGDDIDNYDKEDLIFIIEDHDLPF